MIGRLLKGLVLGLIIGAIAAAVLVKGLGVLSFAATGAPLLAYIAALATGAVVGLVAGKPIWAEGAWIEALLKTFFGALLGAGAMFLLRKFAGVEVDLSKLGAGTGKAGELVVLTLPVIAMVLSAFYEVDNTDGPAPAAGAGKQGRVAGKTPAAKLGAPASSRSMDVDGDGELSASAGRKSANTNKK
jgi:hypothetical protein